MLAILKRAAVILGDGGKPNYAALARALGAQRPAIYVWLRVPPQYCLKLEKITKGKIKRWQVRPDIWPASEFRKPKKTMEMVQ